MRSETNGSKRLDTSSPRCVGIPLRAGLAKRIGKMMTNYGYLWIELGSWEFIQFLRPHSGPENLPSGKRLHNYGKSPFFMGKSTISTGPFSSSQTVNVYQAG